MMLIKPDHEHSIMIPGVPAPVLRPVDIDQDKTGFANLRTLRIYQFDEGAVIDGHAEEDEVFIVVLAGAIELTMVESETKYGPVLLSRAGGEQSLSCAAYLPPKAAYHLLAKTKADVAYIRATASGVQPPKIIFSSKVTAASGIQILVEEIAYAQRLRLRLLHCGSAKDGLAMAMGDEGLLPYERLIHFRTAPGRRVAIANSRSDSSVSLDSWDTMALSPEESIGVVIAPHSSVLILVVAATPV